MFAWHRRRRRSVDSKGSREKHVRRRTRSTGAAAPRDPLSAEAPTREELDVNEHKPDVPPRPEATWAEQVNDEDDKSGAGGSKKKQRAQSSSTMDTRVSHSRSAHSSLSSAVSNGTGRSVRFSADSKSHDGAIRRNQLLDKVLKLFFVESKSVSDLDVLRVCDRDAVKVKELRDGLMLLGERLKSKAGNELVPALPNGGGWGTKLSSYHVPYVATLLGVVNTALTRIDDEASEGGAGAEPVSPGSPGAQPQPDDAEEDVVPAA